MCGDGPVELGSLLNLSPGTKVSIEEEHRLIAYEDSGRLGVTNLLGPSVCFLDLLYHFWPPFLLSVCLAKRLCRGCVTWSAHLLRVQFCVKGDGPTS